MQFNRQLGVPNIRGCASTVQQQWVAQQLDISYWTRLHSYPLFLYLGGHGHVSVL